MRVLAAISGGVDSAVAAARLVREGADVVGVHLRTGVEADGASAGGARSCCGADDARDARLICAHLGIPIYVVDVQDAFSTVIADFVDAYGSGRTPNPCVVCNKNVKFGRLREIAHNLGAEIVATGHYARTERANGRVRPPALDRRAQGPELRPVSARPGAACGGPVSAWGVRERRCPRRGRGRRKFPLRASPTVKSSVSFPTTDYRKYLKKHAPQTLVPGSFVNRDGDVVGSHDGAAGFTTGQRKGLPALGTAHYVRGVDARTGRVEIAERAALMHRVVGAVDINWIDCDEPEVGTSFRVTGRVRHAAPPAPGTLTVTEHGVELLFDDPVFAPARGQALVAYVDAAVLCGGTILQTAREPRGGLKPAGGGAQPA